MRFRRSIARRQADTRTPERIAADTEKRMAEPPEITLQKAQKQLATAIDKPGLMAKLKVNYAKARIYHIENGIPLPRFSNGNYPKAWANDPFNRAIELIGKGNKDLLDAWRRRG